MTASDKALKYTAKAAKGTLTVCVWTAKGTYRLSAATAKAIRQEVQVDAPRLRLNHHPDPSPRCAQITFHSLVI